MSSNIPAAPVPPPSPGAAVGGLWSLEQQLIAAKRRPAGFDYLRLGLAISVICWHTIVTSYGWETQLAVWRSPWRAVFGFILPAFFALSGFLVAGSLERSRTLVAFGGLRVIRLVPALAVEVLLSAILLGPLVTTLPLSEYLKGPELHKYFLNIVGDIHYTLPGVFASNPFPHRVNGQLWTIPAELRCYVTLAALSLFGLAKRAWFVMGVAILGPVVFLVARVVRHSGELPSLDAGVGGIVLVASFLAGVAFYGFRHRLPHDGRIAAAATIATMGLLLLPGGGALVAAPAAYVTVYVGSLAFRPMPLTKYGDYSYGLYLFGYPLQQTFASFGSWAHHWWLNLLVCLPAAAVMAVFSWHVVEKPALKARGRLSLLEDRFLALRSDLRSRWAPAGKAAPPPGGG